jgi:hypothetical protein
MTTSTIKSYTTRANARRALKNICEKCVKFASELIYEEDGRFVFDEDKVEQLMSHEEWHEVWGHKGTGLPEEAEVIKLERREPVEVNSAAVLLGVVNVMNTVICPECGSSELYCGRNDKGLVVDDEYIIGCHHCDWQVDSRKSTKPSSSTGQPREAQKLSMKLDRTIVAYDVENKKQIGIFKNACAMWKANPTWMTSSQEDRLTKELYSAAKAGDPKSVTINGRSFFLLNV